MKTLITILIGLLVVGCAVTDTYNPSDFTPKPITAGAGFAEIQKRAMSDDPEAQYELGGAYAAGCGVLQDSKKSAHWYQKSADNGYIFGVAAMGLLYQQGIGVPKDEARSQELLSKAVPQIFEIAKNGDRDAQNWLGYMYYTGEGAKKDLRKAIEWHKKAAEQNKASAIANLCHIYAGTNNIAGIPDFKESVKYAIKASNLTSVKPTHVSIIGGMDYFLGECFRTGQGVEKNMSKAIEFHKKASKVNIIQSHYILGAIYQNGEVNSKVDSKEAAKWFSIAANQGHLESQAQLIALFFSGGNGLKKNMKGAFKWCFLSGSQPLVPANLQGFENVNEITMPALVRRRLVIANSQSLVGWFYDRPSKSVLIPFYLPIPYATQVGAERFTYQKRDFGKAMEWYKKSAKNGLSRGQFEYAWALANGYNKNLGIIGRRSSDKEALQWINSALKNNIKMPEWLKLRKKEIDSAEKLKAEITKRMIIIPTP